MRPIQILFTALLFTCCINKIYAQVDINGDLEKINKSTRLPSGWNYMSPAMTASYNFELDSVEKQHGKYAMQISSKAADAVYASLNFNIAKKFKGGEIELRGFLKTENVEGVAGLWMGVDGTTAFDNMQNRNIRGTTPWTEYSVKLPYDDDKAVNIRAGAILQGKGKIWFDNVRMFIDGKPIEEAKIKTIALAKAETDTAFINGSGITSIPLSVQTIKNLTMLGQVWGFVKYHHFEVAKGNVNMDAELFRVLPAVLLAKDNIALSNALERWVDKLGAAPACNNCKPYNYKDAKLNPDYGNIFDGSVLTKAFTTKLTNVLNNRHRSNYYVGMTPGAGNPIFDHEQSYNNVKLMDAGCRLLSLFRYWNMIQYFYPNRHLIGDWKEVLPEFIPRFLHDSSPKNYMEAVVQLVSRIHDTHGFVPALSGPYAAPFQAKFIEDQLVVTAYLKDSLTVKSLVKKGDVIKAINGVLVEQLIKKYLPLTSASNYPTSLRDMPMNYLLRSETDKISLSILRDGKVVQANVNAVRYNIAEFRAIGEPDPSARGYRLLNKDIGYIYPARYSNKDLPAIKKLFAETKGIIVDMRCYPSDFMPFTFGEFIKQGDAPFVKFTQGSVEAPGYFHPGPMLTVKGDGAYKGKVVVIVNERAQSQAEYTTMAFQSSPNVTVIGSTTAGADGNVSTIMLPGGIQTAISGIGVLYPDGTESQRVGVKIDKQVKPTIAGVKVGKDELLEEAVRVIEDGK
nr:S41 family peptidase [uncultured Mucilaginibacter sp.]